MDDYTFRMSDVIDKTSIEHDNIALIRHTPSHEHFQKVWAEGIGFFEEYQKIQRGNYFHGREYVFSFIGETKSTARFIAVYKVNGVRKLKKSYVSAEYWEKFGYLHHLNKDYYYDLEKMDILEDLQNRLVIDFVATRNIVHVGWQTIAEKPVVGINSRIFKNYEDIIWKFSDLERYIGNEAIYSDLYLALSSMYGVYLIIDTVDYSQYIGSASGEEGIWGRWRDYLKTNGTGGNKGLKDHLEKNPGRYRNLQFTILETIPKTGSDIRDKKFVQDREAWYKRKFLTRNEETGLNMN